MNTLSRDRKIAVLEALVSGLSLRATEKRTGVGRQAITALLHRTAIQYTSGTVVGLVDARRALVEAHQNLCTPSITPAMSDGRTDHIWSLDELMEGKPR